MLVILLIIIYLQLISEWSASLSIQINECKDRKCLISMDRGCTNLFVDKLYVQRSFRAVASKLLQLFSIYYWSDPRPCVLVHSKNILEIYEAISMGSLEQACLTLEERGFHHRLNFIKFNLHPFHDQIKLLKLTVLKFIKGFLCCFAETFSTNDCPGVV